MKLPPFASYHRTKQTTPREPLYTLQEIADRMGVDFLKLRAYIRGKCPAGCPPPPKSAMRSGNSTSYQMRTKLYKLSEFKAWWTIRQEFANKETP